MSTEEKLQKTQTEQTVTAQSVAASVANAARLYNLAREMFKNVEDKR